MVLNNSINSTGTHIVASIKAKKYEFFFVIKEFIVKKIQLLFCLFLGISP